MTQLQENSISTSDDTDCLKTALQEKKEIQYYSKKRVWLVFFSFCVILFFSTEIAYAFTTSQETTERERIITLKEVTIETFLQEKSQKMEGEVLQKDGTITPDHQQNDIEPVVELYDSAFVLKQYIQRKAIEKSEQTTIQEKILRRYLEKTPMEVMIPHLVKQKPEVCAFLIAIAKKESAWGDRAPVLNGKDCYNYWGYRAKSDRMGSGGHTCFDSPADAIDTVGKRIATLVEEGNDTPEKMVTIWKCGRTCDGHRPESVEKWVKDVKMYFIPLMQETTVTSKINENESN